MSIPTSVDNKKGAIKCNCAGCVDLNTKEMHDHLNNLYAQLNEQNKLIHSQEQTLTLILKEVIPLLKSITGQGAQTNTLLNKIISFKNK